MWVILSDNQIKSSSEKLRDDISHLKHMINSVEEIVNYHSERLDRFEAINEKILNAIIC